MRWIGTLPGISSAGDYASGVSVDGTEYSHIIWYRRRLRCFFLIISGIFSVFNAEHYPVVRVEKSVHTPDMPPPWRTHRILSTTRSPSERLRGGGQRRAVVSNATVTVPVGKRARHYRIGTVELYQRTIWWRAQGQFHRYRLRIQ